MTDDFYLVHMTGKTQTKSEWVSAIRTGEMRYHDATEDHVEVQNGTELIGQSRVLATIWDVESTWRLQLHLYCVRQNGSQLIDHITAGAYSGGTHG